MKKKTMIKKVREIVQYSTVCEICQKSVEHEDKKQIYIIRLKEGVRGIHARRQWRTKESFYFCKDCLDVNLKLTPVK